MKTLIPSEIPTVHIETGAGVHPSSIDFALALLRSSCASYPVAALDMRITRTGPGSVRTEASATVLGRTITAQAAGSTPRRAVADVCARLTARVRMLA